MQILTPGPGPPAGRRRGRERTPCHWGNALSTGYMGRELELNLQKTEREKSYNVIKLYLLLQRVKSVNSRINRSEKGLLYLWMKAGPPTHGW